VLHAAAKAINGPGRDHVDLPGGGILQQTVKVRTPLSPLGTADAGIFVNADNVPPDRAATAASSRRWLSVV
jgi:hypothetical protein